LKNGLFFLGAVLVVTPLVAKQGCRYIFAYGDPTKQLAPRN
jgi:hypothetical protein